MRFSFENMTHHTHLEDKLGGVDNFRAWKYIISLILEENDLDQYINGEGIELHRNEDKKLIRRTWLKPRESLQIQSRISPSPVGL